MKTTSHIPPVAIYRTRAEALAVIETLDAGNYYLAHGEYARPYYSARKVRGEDSYYIHARLSFYVGTFYARPSGPLHVEDVPAV